MVNAAIAFLAVDLIARRWLDGDKRLLVPLLLLLTPFYQFHGQRFGTNQVLLSTWPIATYCFLRSFETRTVIWSVAAGITAALAMLGKYYSVVLIAAFVTGRELTREWRHVTEQPLRIVTGESGLADAVTFYSEDHPAHWTPGKIGLASRIDEQRLNREGWAGVCTLTAASCIEHVERTAGGSPVIRTLYEHSASFLGHSGRPQRFVLFIVPPM
jgi:hypothetical protein